jgi:Skp family chaperone for outer membrane proteins
MKAATRRTDTAPDHLVNEVTRITSALAEAESKAFDPRAAQIAALQTELLAKSKQLHREQAAEAREKSVQALETEIASHSDAVQGNRDAIAHLRAELASIPARIQTATWRLNENLRLLGIAKGRLAQQLNQQQGEN